MVSLLILNLIQELSGVLGFIQSEIREDVDHAGLSVPLSLLKIDLLLKQGERPMSFSAHKI